MVMMESLNKLMIWYLTNFYGFFAKRQGIADSGKLKTLMPKFGVKPNVSGSYFFFFACSSFCLISSNTFLICPLISSELCFISTII